MFFMVKRIILCAFNVKLKRHKKKEKSTRRHNSFSIGGPYIHDSSVPPMVKPAVLCCQPPAGHRLASTGPPVLPLTRRTCRRSGSEPPAVNPRGMSPIADWWFACRDVYLQVVVQHGSPQLHIIYIS